MGNIAAEEGQEFGIVFAAMGVTNDVADYFRRSFEEDVYKRQVRTDSLGQLSEAQVL